jgi:hypothetical protein
MKKPPVNVLELPLIERAEMALKAAVERVMEEHAREGFPVYVLRDDEIIEISAEELRTRYPRKLQES